MLLVVALAAMAIVAGPTAALAQTKPAVTSSGRISPRRGIFIGNSFFYYNNGLPGHLSLMEKAADPENKHGLPQHHGDDRRLRLRLA